MAAHARNHLGNGDVQLRDHELIPTELVGVPADTVARVWPKISRLVEIALSRLGGEYTASQIMLDLLARDKQLWLALDKETGDVEGVCITCIDVFPTGLKKALVFLLTGRERQRWLPYGKVIEAWAAEQGCDAIRAWARPGWEPDFPEYKRTRILLEKSLGR